MEKGKGWRRVRGERVRGGLGYTPCEIIRESLANCPFLRGH